MRLFRLCGANSTRDRSVSKALFARFFSVKVSASLAFSETSVFHCRHRSFPVAGNRPSYAGKIFYCLGTLAEPFLPVTGLRERANASRARFFRARYTLPLLRCGRALLSCRGPSRADATRAHFTCARIAYTAAANCFDLSRVFAHGRTARVSLAQEIAFACTAATESLLPVAGLRKRTHCTLVSFVREVTLRLLRCG